MQFETKRLAHALDIAALVIERRNTIPVLGCALLRMQTEGPGADVVVTGTDLDLQIRAYAPVESHVAGDAFDVAMFAPDKISRLIRVAGDRVDLQQEEGQKVRIRGGQLDATIGGLPSDDFPVLTQAPVEEGFSATLGTAGVDMILRVAGAMSTEEVRYYLNGVYIHHVEGWTYRAVATDGHRLHIGTIELPDAEAAIGKHEGNGRGIIIPRKAINTLRRLRPSMAAETPVRMFAGAGGPQPNRDKDLAPEARAARTDHSRAGFTFQAGATRVEMVSKLIDGTFPDYTRVVPQQDASFPTVAFSRRSLANALDALMCGISKRSKAIKLTFDPAGKLVVSCHWIDFSFTGKIEIEAKSNVRQPFEVGYNGRYLRQIVDANTGDDLSICTQDSVSPGSIIDPAATDFRTVLMPMRI